MSATSVADLRPSPAALLPLLLLALLPSCRGMRTLADPTLEIRTPGGRELGVATDHGVVFLGRTARAGEVEVTAWFGDGPGTELSVIEPLGGGLYTAPIVIRLPTVPLTFEVPAPGTTVHVIGRDGADLRITDAVVRTDRQIDGLLLSIPSGLVGSPDQLGAGVYVVDPDTKKKTLLGLVSGRVRLTEAEGGVREYMTVVGPEELWRVVTRDLDGGRRRRWVYRRDIL